MGLITRGFAGSRTLGPGTGFTSGSGIETPAMTFRFTIGPSDADATSSNLPFAQASAAGAPESWLGGQDVATHGGSVADGGVLGGSKNLAPWEWVQLLDRSPTLPLLHPPHPNIPHHAFLPPLLLHHLATADRLSICELM